MAENLLLGLLSLFAGFVIGFIVGASLDFSRED